MKYSIQNFFKEISLNELINPLKTPEEVAHEIEIGHDLYKKSHNDYYPSEKICRGCVSHIVTYH